MSNVPEELKYTESHEWVRLMDDGSLQVGISDHAQESLGELVFVELPEPGLQVSQGDAVAVVESVKAASDIYSPVDGEVVEVNTALADAPDLVNQEPYDGGWLMRIEASDPDAMSRLLNAQAYESVLEE